jgi:DNA adenine methylase Dam
VLEKIYDSFLNYQGGKGSLYKELSLSFPKGINTLVEPFVGSGVISVNTDADKYVLNDFNTGLYKIWEWLLNTPKPEIFRQINNTVDEFGLARDDEEAFNSFKRLTYKRDGQTGLNYYLCASMSFTNLFEVDRLGKFVVGFGKRCFNSSMEAKLDAVLTWADLHKCKIKLFNESFERLDYSGLGGDDFVYLDPPYLITPAVYSKYWLSTNEQKLYKLCDELDNNGVKFGLSNVLKSGNKTNKLLDRWKDKYFSYYPKISYDNSMRGKKSKGEVEIYVTNYKV